MKRSISIAKGKGSIGHNSREFKAENVDPERVKFNTCYVNENLQQVYHKLFDKALENYNSKQKRSDRKIPDYYEKIRTSKQEKLFYEIIVQVGNSEDMSAISDNGKLAEKILDLYMKDFQERNKSLYVFSAHLHMDEATPHLHIDFVPFSEHNKRGLETKTTLKGALQSLGFNGGTKGDTELNQWQNFEKQKLSEIMLEFGIEWEKKGNDKEHLSVLDYKKEVRTSEVEKLTHKLEKLQSQEVKIDKIDSIEVKAKTFDKSKVIVEKSDFEDIRNLAKKQVVYEKNDEKLLAKINDLEERNSYLAIKIDNSQDDNKALKGQIVELKSENSKLKDEIYHFQFFKNEAIHMKKLYEKAIAFIEKLGFKKDFDKILKNKDKER